MLAITIGGYWLEGKKFHDIRIEYGTNDKVLLGRTTVVFCDEIEERKVW